MDDVMILAVHVAHLYDFEGAIQGCFCGTVQLVDVACAASDNMTNSMSPVTHAPGIQESLFII